VNLSWTASTDNVGVTGYRVYRNGSTTPLATVSSGTAYTDSTVAASTQYTYTVTAVDAAGNESTASTGATVTTPAGGTTDTTPPSTPTNLTATASSSTAVSLSWTASTDNVGVTGYNVYRNGGSTPIGTATGTTYSDTSVAASTPYTYTVKAFDAAGNLSAASTSASVTTPSGGSTGTLAFTPTNDATVNKGAPTTNYGTANRIIAGGSPLNSFFVQFDVTGTSACTVTSAKLQLTVGSTSADNAPYGGDVYGVPTNTWSESTVNWNNQPAASSTLVASIPTAVKLNTAYTWDVTPLITGDGLVSMKVVSANSDAAKYWSKDGSTSAQAPQLQVTCS
jgi:chitodextrinase